MLWYKFTAREVISFGSYLARAFAFGHLVSVSYYEFKLTGGESMLPTLNTQWDYVHLSKVYKFGRGVQMGDIIVLAKPTEPEERVVMRITGMPGDIIIIDPSNDSIGVDYNEKKNRASFDKYIKVPEGHVWVTGDNLLYSLDSRTYSALPMALIKGKIIAANDFNDGWSSFWGFRKVENNFNEMQTEE